MLLTRQQSHAVDRLAIDAYGIPSLVLMENAGRGAVDILLKIDASLVQGNRTVTILCGKGNNAGDGFVMARHLKIFGASAQVVLFVSPSGLQGDARQNFLILEKIEVPVVDLSAIDDQSSLHCAMDAKASDTAWIIDAMLGTGATGAPREPLDSAIAWANGQTARRMAVDVPSGLDCDTGVPAPTTFRAERTCTFVAPKIGFETATAAEYCGQMHVVSIGIPPQLVLEAVASST